MKKIVVLALVLALTVCTAQGCRFPDITDYLASITYTDAPSDDPSQGATPVPTEAPTEAPTETPEAAPTQKPTPEPEPLPEGVSSDIGAYARECVIRASGIMDEVVDYISRNPIPGSTETVPFTGTNRFRELSYEGLMLYERLLTCAKEFRSYRSNCSNELMSQVLDALYADHPELEVYFAVEREEGGNRGDDNSGKDGMGTGEDGAYRSVFFLPEGRYYAPTTDKETVMAQVEAFDVVSRYIAYRIPKTFSAIDQYRCIAYYISINSKYAHVENEEIPRYATNAYGAVINGWSICQGYTIGFEYLCRVAGLDCRRVRNAFNDENMHFWDVVTVGNNTYYVDVTWADGSVSNYYDPVWFDWFMFVADQNHVSNDGTATTGPALDKSGWR